ncbi:hypothetical protein EYZ11_010704 [Aspergillus tanneri]|uniref:Xylanolytic transcriptional activator regulatory domain-containing protein n=1 Tax=Aspergillus tanneri TaxID=1220188 RepID=A0A4S3J4M8_9EURO|nr:uncharacterized protein ATNIH1004_007022 [Aspergillus tanneri]KAA8645603.1 hypothetical protein ATNIH1004_007022 [Aspergillus tanneri]THC89836.1 hypothetical protein EYZ11_010704 [Aspergillus tanneri]
MNDFTSQHRQLAPGPSPTAGMPDMPMGEAPPGDSYRKSSDSKKRVSMACLACKKSKRKCIFDETLDQRRRVAAKRTADELSYHRDMLNDMLKVMKAEDQSHALRLLDIVRADATAEEIRAFIDETLAQISGMGKNSRPALQKFEEVRRIIDLEGGPSFRPQVMDIHYLCDEVPHRVPAKPWTTITQDSGLVSHLVSLYFTWDYPFHAFLDREVFLTHMVSGNVKSEFCSPFLVNALLANACHYSDYSEAYVDPGDLLTKGADFLAEAERLRDEETTKLSLTFLQGTLLLFERYSLCGNNDLGYKMLHQAIWTGEALGLIGPKANQGQLSEHMDVSIRRTAWGLFHIDTYIHAGFLRPSLINKVSLEPPAGVDDTSLWTPYPSHRAARPSQLSRYFTELYELCKIARDISQRLFAMDGASPTVHNYRQIKETLYERLCQWYDALPESFDPQRKPPPYVLLLRMRYDTLLITMFSFTPQENTLRFQSEAPQTPESTPSLSPQPKCDADEIIQSAIRDISCLALVHRREYGMTRAHYFALYAINLALFTMLARDAFDILHPDFLSLTSSFHSIASRSPVGRGLFYLFREKVRAKGQGQRLQESDAATADLKTLFDEQSSSYPKLEEYARGLEKLNQDERYRGIPGEGDESISSMLDRYESLSLGKDEIAPERARAGDR